MIKLDIVIDKYLGKLGWFSQKLGKFKKISQKMVRNRKFRRIKTYRNPATLVSQVLFWVPVLLSNLIVMNAFFGF